MHNVNPGGQMYDDLMISQHTIPHCGWTDIGDYDLSGPQWCATVTANCC